jgi:hypothetical protein
VELEVVEIKEEGVEQVVLDNLFQIQQQEVFQLQHKVIQ